jgi:hypothetical protein
MAEFRRRARGSTREPRYQCTCLKQHRLAWCLDKDSRKRFSTAKELGAALDAVTFRSMREMSAPREESSGVSGTMAC